MKTTVFFSTIYNHDITSTTTHYIVTSSLLHQFTSPVPKQFTNYNSLNVRTYLKT